MQYCYALSHGRAWSETAMKSTPEGYGPWHGNGGRGQRSRVSRAATFSVKTHDGDWMPGLRAVNCVEAISWLLWGPRRV